MKKIAIDKLRTGDFVCIREKSIHYKTDRFRWLLFLQSNNALDGNPTNDELTATNNSRFHYKTYQVNYWRDVKRMDITPPTNILSLVFIGDNDVWSFPDTVVVATKKSRFGHKLFHRYIESQFEIPLFERIKRKFQKYCTPDDYWL